MNAARTLRPSCLLAVLACAPALLLSFPAQANDDKASLGRLFHTPHKRAILDSMRGRDVKIPTEERFDSVRLDGIVRRNGRATTVWINGKAHQSDDAPVEQIGESTARVVAGEQRSINVRVGQTVTLSPGGETGQ